MKIKYNLGQQLTAYILLVSLLLQSCYNPNIPIGPIQPVEEKTTNLIIAFPQEEPNNQADESKSMVELAASSLIAEGLVGQIEQGQDTNVPVVHPKNLAQPSYQTTASIKLSFPRKAGIQLINRSICFSHIPFIRQTLGELAGRRKAMAAVAPNKEAWSKSYTSKGGHEVRFQELTSGKWQAAVEESLPAGISRMLLLPVYTLSDYSIATLSNKSPEWQKNHIHVVLQKAKSYVIVGNMGLAGGMYQDEDEDKEEQKVVTGGYFGVGSSAQNVNIPSEFTSDKGLTYEIFKSITLEVAKEVETQTGQVILLKPGTTTTGFTIGKGNFGELRLGKDKKSGKYYGIKILSFTKLEDLEEARAEAKLQLRLTGLPHLMPLVDAGEGDNDDNNSTLLYQVMPLASLGNGADLAAYLQTIKDAAFKEALLVHVAKSILKGFAAMHNLDESIAHLDFKPANLVIDKEGSVYIIDFGCSAYLNAKDQIKEFRTGDKNYFSPERYEAIYSSTPQFNGKSSDNWTVGLSMLELATGIFEYKEGIVSGDPGWYVNEHPFLRKTALGSYAAIVKGFLNPNEKERLTVEEALSLPIFEQDTRPEVLKFLKEFVQNMQTNKRKEKLGGEVPGLTSVQQLPLPHFTGYASRPELEQAVIKQLEEKASLVACVGMGGVGKTQLLTYLVHSKELQQGYKHIYWFQAADKEESLLQQYHGLAQELKLPGIDEKTPVEEAKAALIDFLEEGGSSTLLVFDNADEPEILATFLPKGRCQTLVSSRSPHWKNKVAVEVFTSEQVRELLTKLLLDRKTTFEEARLLGEVLGYLPLALNQAIAWMRQEKTSVSDYVTSYTEKQQELLKTSSQLYGKKLPNTMDTLYQMQLLKLSKTCPEAIKLLEYTSLLAPDNIPVLLLSKGLLLEEGTLSSRYENAQRVLLDYGLWQEDKNVQYVRIHRLMQDVVRLPLGSERTRRRFIKLAERISDEYKKETTLMADEAQKKRLLPHLEALEELARKDKDLANSVQLANILDCIGYYYLYQQGSYEKACTLYEETLAIKKKNYPAGHIEIGRTLENLGIVYGRLGDYQERKKLLEEALLINKANYPEGHIEIGRTLENLGTAYGSLGDYQEKKKLLSEALEIKKSNYPAGHIEIGKTLRNLGNAYGDLGDYQEKKKLLSEALEIQKANYPAGHINVGRTLANLGTAYGSLGDYQEQKKLLSEALEIKKANYPAGHIEIGITLGALGNAYGDLGDYQEKKKLLEEALEIQKANYPAGHINVGRTLANLGTAYGSLGDYQEQKKLLSEALEIKKANYPAGHREIGITLGALGTAYEDLGDYQEQKKLLEEAFLIMQKHYPAGHINIGITLENLGNAYGRLGDYQEQKKLLLEALEIKKANYPAGHIEIGKTLENLGTAYSSLGDYQEQKKLLVEALEIKKANYPAGHIEIGRTLENLGTAYGSLGDYQEQKKLLVEALEIKKANYPSGHIEIGRTLVNLGNAYGLLGDYEKQKELLEKP